MFKNGKSVIVRINDRGPFSKNRELDLSYGRITYIDVGQGETVLSVHGLFGGYD